jgi:hypothetical protein
MPDAGVDDVELAAACGGAVPVTFDDWENCYKRRRCQFEVGCIPQNAYRDVQDCLDHGDAVEGGRLSAELRARRQAVLAGRASINLDAFRHCVVEIGAARCNTTQSNVSCALRFRGTRGDDASCDTDAECVSPGARCAPACTDACCAGTCQPKFKVGQPCRDDENGNSCEPGLQCDHTCRAGDVGTVCSADRDCDTNAWCHLVHAGQPGACEADFVPGAECTNAVQCGGETSCVDISIVLTNPGHCLRISHPGDHCDFFCYGNLFCDASGTCRSLPQRGQSCGLVSCGGVDTFCDANSMCVLRANLGDACDARPCLPGLFCTSELNDPTPTCERPRPDGANCALPGHCESYLCSGNKDRQGVCLTTWSDSCPLSSH